MCDIEIFERFVTERFLDFYNQKEKHNFSIHSKADSEERNKPTYDFRCIDIDSGKKMAIEIKRLFSNKKTHLKTIDYWINKFITKPLKGVVKGEYVLLIKGFKSPFSSNIKNNIRLLFNIKSEIRSVKDPGEYYRFRCHPEICLARTSKEGSIITPWTFDFSVADEEEIIRIIDASIKKFDNDNYIHIILLVELTSETRRTEIPIIIENMELGIGPDTRRVEPRKFNIIDGIYHIGMHHKTVIARVFPKDKIYESFFFDPTEFMEPSSFKQFINNNLL